MFRLCHKCSAISAVLAVSFLFLWPGPLKAQNNPKTPAQPPAAASPQTVNAYPNRPWVTPIFALPRQVTLCGENFPLDQPDVFERLDMEFTIAVYGQSQVVLWLKRAGRYFPYIEKRLAQEGLPDDLKYLAVAESDLRPHVYSSAKALGTWQFIAETGRRYGLRKDKYFDDRLNFEKSTEAAVLYLKKLKSDFGSWLLAMAAYNCGEGCVSREIEEQGVSNYFRLDLPRETERYVYRIAAIKIILENYKHFGYSMPQEYAYKVRPVDRVPVNIAQRVHFAQAARAVGTDYKGLKELNPEIFGRYLPPGSYDIAIPAGQGRKMLQFLNQIPAKPAATNKTSQNTRNKYYRVKKGDTLTQISNKTGVSIDELRRMNNLRGSNIAVGQNLKIAP